MSDLQSIRKSEIEIGSPSRPNRGRGSTALSRGTFTDEQLELAGAKGSVSAGMATIYDFCGTIHFCTTYTTTCTRSTPEAPSPR